MNVLSKSPTELSASASNWRRTFEVLLSSRWWNRYIKPLLFILVGIGFGMWVRSFLDRPHFSIRPDFQHAYNRHPELGLPQDNAMSATLPNKDGHGVIQAQFDKAWLLWLDNPGKLYAVPIVPLDQPFTDADDDFSISDRWAYSNDEIGKRPAFKDMPSSCKFPQGGFAFHWDKQPAEWRWIGCGEWYCEIDGRDVFFQDFAGGRIIGPIRTGKDADSSQLIVLINNGHKYVADRSEEKPPNVLDCAF